MRQAVILAAGFGSRLARDDRDIKPLRSVGGSTLIRRNLLLLESCGVERVVVVIGYRAEALREAVTAEAADLGLELVFVVNPDFERKNGISVLCARPHIDGDFILMMADHVFDRAIVEQAVATEVPASGAVLFVDRKIDRVFDLDDATKVVTDGTRVLEIGKGLTRYNAIDTGIFACSPALFEALEAARAASPDADCSLSEGVAALRERGDMFVADIGAALWQDVDDEHMLANAERLLGEDLVRSTVAHLREPVSEGPRPAL